MKAKWYFKNAAKAVLSVLSVLCVCITAGSLFWAASYLNWSGGTVSDLCKDSYVETESFARDVYWDAHTILNWIGDRETYEQLQSVEPGTLVDVAWLTQTDVNQAVAEELAESSDAVSGPSAESGAAADGLYYTVEALKNWGRLTEADNEIVVCFDDTSGNYHYYWLTDFEQMVRENKIVLRNSAQLSSDSPEQEEVLSTLSGREEYESDGAQILYDETLNRGFTSWWVYEGYAIREAFPPNGYTDLLALANNDLYWNGRLQEAYRTLAAAIDSIQYVSDTANMTSPVRFQEGNTNLAWLYVSEDGTKIYTNQSRFASSDNINDVIFEMKSYGRYCLINETLEKTDSNIAGISSADLQSLQTSFGNVGTFIIAVDQEWPIQDTYYSAAQDFSQYHGYVLPLLCTAAAAGVLFIVGLVFLTLGAGRKTGEEELYLNAFDRCKTGLGAALVLALWGVVSAAAMTAARGGFGEIAFFVLLIVYAAISTGLFLWGYLSLVKRLKAHIVWKNSLCRMFGNFVKTVWTNVPYLARFILCFGVYVILHWLLCTGRASVWLLLLAVDGCVFVYGVHYLLDRRQIRRGMQRISEGDVRYQIPTERMKGELYEEAKLLNEIGRGMDRAVEESLKNERMKTELITNVSHDIKTPLTSIINYIELIRREQPKDAKIQEYLEVLDKKSQQLKRLTEDVVEASKASSGAVKLEKKKLNLVEMVCQTNGEFEEKMQLRHLEICLNLPEQPVYILADGQKTWRILENLFENAWKYSMPNTRVYAEVTADGKEAVFSMKNISEYALNIPAEELMERFKRGDASRNSEGSGLGLSIAESLAKLQGGSLTLVVDGDLFKAILKFPCENV